MFGAGLAVRTLLARLLLVVTIALVPALGFLTYTEIESRQIRQQLVEDEVLRLVRLVRSDQQRIVEGAEQVLDTLSTALAVQDKVPGLCQRLLAGVLAQSPRYKTIAVIGLDGHHLCGPAWRNPGVDLSDRAYFRLALQTGGFVVGEFAMGRSTAIPSLHMAKPFTTPDGKVAGVIEVGVSTDWIQQQLEQVALPPGTNALIADRSGTILARRPAQKSLIGQPILPTNRFMLEGNEIRFATIKARAGNEVFSAYSPPGADQLGLLIKVSLDRATSFAVVTHANRIGLLLILGGAGLALAITALVGRRLIRRPLLRLLAVADRWRAGDLAARTGLRADDSEFGRLAGAFDAMAAALQTRERALHTALESTTDSVIVFDRNWRITYMNARTKAHVAQGRDVVGQILWDAFPGTSNSVFAAGYRAAMEGGEPVHTVGYSPAFNTWFEAHAYPSNDGVTSFFRDVTEERRLAAALQESEQLFRGTFEQMAVGMALVSLDGDWQRVNDKLCAITGYTRDELLARSFQDITHPDDLELDLALKQALVAGEIALKTIEKRYIRKDGGVVWVNNMASLLRDAEGRPERIIVVIEDISERKRIAGALARSEQLFRGAFEQAAVGVVVTGLDRSIQFVNDRFCAITGYTREELFARTCLEFTHPDDRGVDAPQKAALLAGEFATYIFEKRYLRKDGSVAWVRLTCSALCDPGGRPEGSIGVVEDITARKQVEAALARSEQLFRGTFEQAAVGMAQVALDGRWLNVNEKLCAIVGYSRDELLALTYQDIILPDDIAADRDLARALLAGKNSSEKVEKRYRRKDGNVVWVDFTGGLLRDAAGQPDRFIAVIEDITARKQVEAALARSERLFRAIFEQAAVGIALLSPDGAWLRVNSKTCAMFGYAREDLLARGIMDLTHPDDREAGRALAKQLLTCEIDSYAREKRFLHKDGSIIWTYVTMSVLRDPDGGPDLFIGTAQDISEPKRIEAALQESEARLRLAQEAAGIGIWEYDIAAQTQRWSPEQYRLHGLDPNVGAPNFQQWLDFLEPEDRAIILDAADALLADGNDSLKVEFRIRRGSDGACRWLASLGRLVKDSAGRPCSIMGVNFDITEWRQAEADLRHATALLRSIGDCSPDLIFAKDIEGRFVFANPATIAVIGKPAEAFIGLTNAEWHHDPEQAAAIMANDRRILQTGRAEIFEEALDVAGLGTRIFRSAKTPLRMPDGRVIGVAAVASDITQIKQTEAELRRLTTNLETRVQAEIASREAAQIRAAQAERLHALGLLAGGIAHDFNNVLQAVAGAAALIQDRPAEAAGVRRFAGRLLEASERGASITRRLLTFGRRAELHAAPLDAADLLHGLQELLAHTLGAGIVVEVRLEAELPPLLADRAQLETALVNLASNARDAMRAGG